MAHSRLLKFTFTYDEQYLVPLIPIRFIDNDGNPIPTFNAILDSGADEVTIPKELADELQLELSPRPDLIHTAGGEMQAFTAIVNFNIGRGGREVEYTDINICVIDKDMPVLVGIEPVFKDYMVTIMAYENKIILEPRD